MNFCKLLLSLIFSQKELFHIPREELYLKLEAILCYAKTIRLYLLIEIILNWHMPLYL